MSAYSQPSSSPCATSGATRQERCVLLGRALGAVAQARLVRGGGFVQPGRHGLQQRGGVFAGGQQRAGDVPAFGTLQHQQHALGAAEFGDFVDQEVVQRGLAAQLVQAQAAVHQALEGVGQVAGQTQVFQALRLGHAAPRGFGQPGRHQRAVDLQLVQVAAAQAFVGHVAHRHQHQRLRLLQRGPGFVVAAQGGQRAVCHHQMSWLWPKPVRAKPRSRRQAMPRRVARRAAAASPALQQQARQRDLHIQLEAGVVRAHLAQEGAQPLQRAGGVALGGRRARRRTARGRCA